MSDMTPTQTFISTLRQTPTLASNLKTNLQRIKGNLQQIITYLTYPKTVADDLTKLSTALNTTIDLLTVVSVVPEIGQAASAVKNVLRVLQQQVTPAKNAAVSLESKVKPVREALQNLAPLLDKAIQTADNISTTSASFLGKFIAVSDCVNSLPQGSVRTQSEQYLNDFSNRFQPAVQTLNTTLSTTNSTIDSFYSALQQLMNALSPLQAISSAIKQFLSALQPLTNLLDELQNALRSIKITLPLPYPISVSLYDIFDNFKEFIALAMKPIEALVDEILAALHIQLPPIPGLSDLINLRINLPSIPDLSAIIQALMDALAQLQIGFNLFHLDCSPPHSSQSA